MKKELILIILAAVLLCACQSTTGSPGAVEKAEVALLLDGRIYYALGTAVISFDPGNIGEVRVEAQLNEKNAGFSSLLTNGEDALYVEEGLLETCYIEELELQTGKLKEHPNGTERILLCRWEDEYYLLVNDYMPNSRIVRWNDERETPLLEDVECYSINSRMMLYLKELEADIIYGYDFQTGKTEVVLRLEDDYINSIYATDKTILFTRFTDNSIWLYDIRSKQMKELTELDHDWFDYSDGKAFFKSEADGKTTTRVLELDTGIITDRESVEENNGIWIGDWRYYSESVYHEEALTVDATLYRTDRAGEVTEKIYTQVCEYTKPPY